MCGIVAVVGADAVEAARLEAGLDAIAHRGPDGRGTWHGEGVALGHVRLAVTDPAGGAQPIANEDGSIVAIVNGELYDHAETARWLRTRGHVLRSRCDAEVLVHLYEELGDEVVQRVRGELAFVLWDARERRLLAGRDRFGIKPLVWATWRGGLAVASEAKALFALGVPVAWDDEVFAHAAHTQYTWPDRTLFAGVHQLEPGHAMVWDGAAPKISRYWTPSFGDASTRDVGATLRDAVRVRSQADAPVCVQLSGGLDSTTVAALSGVKDAFTVGFVDGGAYDERAIARLTAAELGLELREVVVDGAAIAAHWPAVVAHGENLAINGHLVGKWLLSRAMRDAGFKIALTGEGADEVFAGYPHLRADAGVLVEQGPSRGVMLPSGPALDLEGVRDRLGYTPTWIAAKATLGKRVQRLLVRDLHVADPFGELLDRLGYRDWNGSRSGRENGGEGTRARLHVSTDTWMRTALAQYILRTLGDGMEMAHGIEGRVPFLDHHVAEAAFALAPEALVGTGIDKPVLRAAVAKVVPAHVRARPKHPFLAPPLSRLAPALVQDMLRSHARVSALVDRANLLAVLDALPAMSDSDRQAWDPALMLILSAAILQARYAA